MDHDRTHIKDAPQVDGFVYGLGPTMQTVNDMAAEISRTDIPVLIVGESGTGKDAYARLIHRLSLKKELRLQRIDCATFDPGQLLNQPRQSSQSLFAGEPCGTLYFDNVQDLDMACQRALLPHLPDGQSASLREENWVRIISSATRSLESEVEGGRFRRELYFRLNGACLRLPPLRERIEDIPVLTEYFLSKHSTLLNRKAPPLSNKAMQDLAAYHWPGNIRELENFARKIVVFGDAAMALNDLHTTWMAAPAPIENVSGTPLKVAARVASKRAERELIMQALERTHWNRKRAARDLQISYKSLLYKIKQIGERKA